MSEIREKLNTRIGEVADLRRAVALLEWDERVCMPAGGVGAHGDMLATLQRLAHEKFTADEVGDWLATLQTRPAPDGPDSPAARLLAVTARDYDKARRVPAAFVAELAQVTSAAHDVWRQARAASDFKPFVPHLRRIIDLKRRYVSFFPPAGHPYDVVLDDFEPGMTTVDIQAMFDTLRPRQVALIAAVRDRPAIDDGFLHQEYAESEMVAFAVDVITAFGFDWTRGRQDKSTHPFATSMGPDDVRITTRFDPRQPFGLLFGSLHETGHGLYEQGFAPDWNRTLVEGGASLGVHESQSRLWENLVGRSRPFWEHFFPILQRRFPAQLGGITLDRFYRGINRVQPAAIRVEADEATYNLHVMLRVEMEMAMLGGDVEVHDLPELWDQKMREYLGLVPVDAAAGILQDIHWSIGLFGYFATYTVGNVISAQLWDRYRTLDPACDDRMRRGDFTMLRAWLRDEIHQHARRYQPQELVQRVTGSRIDPAPYLRYLDAKYGELYGL